VRHWHWAALSAAARSAESNAAARHVARTESAAGGILSSADEAGEHAAGDATPPAARRPVSPHSRHRLTSTRAALSSSARARPRPAIAATFASWHCTHRLPSAKPRHWRYVNAPLDFTSP